MTILFFVKPLVEKNFQILLVIITESEMLKIITCSGNENPNKKQYLISIYQYMISFYINITDCLKCNDWLSSQTTVPLTYQPGFCMFLIDL